MPYSHNLSPTLSRRSSLSDFFYASSAPSTPVTSAYANDIQSDLRALHMDELVQLANNNRNSSSILKNSHSFTALKDILLFARFLMSTWTRELLTAILWPNAEMFYVFVFDLGSSLILYALLIWCLASNLPISRVILEKFSAYFADGLSLSNSAYPEMFEELSFSTVEAASKTLNGNSRLGQSPEGDRDFNVDVAKLLLQCSAIMYERSEGPVQAAINELRSSSHLAPRSPLFSSLGTQLVNPNAPHFVAAALESEETRIKVFAQRLGLECATISELNTTGTSFCTMFWAPSGNFIILAYRGTASSNFSEWLTDFSASFRDAGSLIRGWDQVHMGFASRAFPENVPSGCRSPYDTIKLAVKTLANHLLNEREPGAQINVWSTGHSLGSAVGSLIYARQITEPLDFGESIRFRDAYFFGTPVVCNNISMYAFEDSMKVDRSRTLWRVTSGNDIVATGVPHRGESSSHGISSLNPLSFAHIGMGVNLESQYECSPIVRTAGGKPIKISSATSMRDADKTSPLENWICWAQNLPIMGCFVSHTTGSYWIQLKNLRAGFSHPSDNAESQ